jgi:hypothetical protein
MNLLLTIIYLPYLTETSDHRKKRPNLLLTEAEERHPISSEPKFTSPQKGKDSLGWAHNQLDTKNIAERERSELSQAIDGSCDRGHYGKTPLSISVISTSTAQILFKEED